MSPTELIKELNKIKRVYYMDSHSAFERACPALCALRQRLLETPAVPNWNTPTVSPQEQQDKRVRAAQKAMLRHSAEPIPGSQTERDEKAGKYTHIEYPLRQNAEPLGSPVHSNSAETRPTTGGYISKEIESIFNEGYDYTHDAGD
jgi:hypothetical protein